MTQTQRVIELTVDTLLGMRMQTVGAQKGTGKKSSGTKLTSRRDTQKETPLVLVVDDDATSRLLMRGCLEDAGFLVEEAEDGVQALFAFERFHPDIILMDVLMPQMDGINACARLRKMRGGDTVPILMVTGLGDVDSINRAYEVGATDFITKPVQWTILEQRVRYMLRASQAFEDIRRSEIRLTEAQRIARLGNWEWDIQRNVLHLSDEVSRIYGLNTEAVNLTYESLLKAVHPDDRALVERSIEKTLKTKGSLDLDHRIVLTDGSERIVHQQAEVSVDKRGKAVRMMGTVQDITERKLAEEQIVYLAYHDTLTSLPNRRFLKEHLKQVLANAERHGRLLSLLFLDLDYFKRINDTLGHDAGDLLLQSVADRLVQCLRKGDSIAHDGMDSSATTVTRLGGDEFTVLLTDIQTAQDAARVADRLLDALSHPFPLGSHEVFIAASIGITMYPCDGQDVDTLLKNADMAMYHAKDRGRNNYQFYAPSMNAAAVKRLSLERSLRKALERREFFLVYQPQLDLATGRIIGVEALIRWQHPELGLVAPAEFMSVAEETGLIVPIGEWVLRTACTQGKMWEKEGLPSIRVSVNLSNRQFRQETLVQVVTEVLRDTGFEASLLELEVTEELLMRDIETTSTMLHCLKAMGVHLCIDDFGTGYSSLSCLKRLPIDALKIDRSFVKNLSSNTDDVAITSAIIALARMLNLKAIAEGVETVKQIDFLREQGCHVIQGFLFSPPLSEEEFKDLLRKESHTDCGTGALQSA